MEIKSAAHRLERLELAPIRKRNFGIILISRSEGRNQQDTVFERGKIMEQKVYRVKRGTNIIGYLVG